MYGVVLGSFLIPLIFVFMDEARRLWKRAVMNFEDCVLHISKKAHLIMPTPSSFFDRGLRGWLKGKDKVCSNR